MKPANLSEKAGSGFICAAFKALAAMDSDFDQQAQPERRGVNAKSHFGSMPSSPLWLAAMAGALIALVLGTALPSKPKIFAILNDAAHVPVFGILALIFWRLIEQHRWHVARPAAAYLSAVVVTTVLGGLIEIIQAFIGRDASFGDLGRDMLGAGCALGILASRDVRLWRVGSRFRGRATVAILAISCGLWALYPVAEATLAYARRAAAFPVLVQFSTPLDLYFLSSGAADLSLQAFPAQWAQTADQQSLRVDFKAGNWPGVTYEELAPDWRNYGSLVVDITNPMSTPLPIAVRVHDAWHNLQYQDRFNRTFQLAPLSRQIIRIPMADIQHGLVGRELDLAHIAGIVIFTNGSAANVGRYFYLTRLWLE